LILFFIYFLASLRLGGEKVTYGDHVLVVGDAAGMIDPMTGL
jgi:flavin-dependent dehydrogenase